MHRFDDNTPVEETLRALDDMVEQGKILYPAASNFAAWQVAKALGISAREGWSPFACLQPMYNLVKRQAEVELLPMALSEGLGVIPYSPLGGGLLTGKYGVGRRPETGRLVENAMYKTRYGARLGLPGGGGLSPTFAQERGYNPVALAVAWVGSHPAVTAPIIGARNLVAARRLAGRVGDRHDARTACGNWRALAGAAARHGSQRGEDGVQFCVAVDEEVDGEDGRRRKR